MNRAALSRLLFPPALRLPAALAFAAAWGLATLGVSGWPLYAWGVWWAAAGGVFIRHASAMPPAPQRLLSSAGEAGENDAAARRLGLLFAAAGKTLPVYIAAPDPPHANAAVVGWGAGRRILLTEGLLKILTPMQIAAVVAHELGHVRRRHHGQWLLAQGAAGLAFALLWASGGGGVWIGLSTAYLWAWGLRPLAAKLRRRWEFEADALAKALGLGPALGEALCLLTPSANLPVWLSFHPETASRLARLNKGQY